MNDNARQLYEDLKAGRLKHFDMRNPECCIGGTARYRDDQSKYEKGEPHTGGAKTAAYLGIKPHIYHQLCYGRDPVWDWSFDPYGATQQQAAEALKRACELSEAK